MSAKSVSHPYYPKDLDVKNYNANTLGVTPILGGFFAGLMIIILPVAFWMLKDFKGSMLRKLIIFWLLVSGFIHIILEGHFAWFYEDIASRMDFLSQIWKEYGRADSRYMTQDSFTVCMETITAAVEGPLCLITAYCFVIGHPSRYVLQLCVSLGQFYGCVLYFSIEYFEGFAHGPYNHPLYFWFYFFFMNIIWIIIPFLLIVDSCRNLCLAQSRFDSKSAKKH